MTGNLQPISDPALAQALSVLAAAMTIAAPSRPAGMSALRFGIFEAIDRLDEGAGVTYHALQRETKLSSATLGEHLRSLRYKGLVVWSRIALSSGGAALLKDHRPKPQQPIVEIFPIAVAAPPRGDDEPAAVPTQSPPGPAAGTSIPAPAKEPLVAENRVVRPAEKTTESRLETIRAVARRLAEKKPAQPRLPTVIGVPTPPEQRVARKPDWIEERRIRLQGAIAFLKSKCILVQVHNPDAPVRQYLMSGNFNRFTAEQVIARATRLGWEGEAQ